MYIRVNYLRKNSFYDIAISDELKSNIKQGDFVILGVGEGREEVGKVVFMHDFETTGEKTPTMLRKATPEDVVRIARLQQEEQEAFALFMEKVLHHNLDMQPVCVFFSFDGKHADFVFTANERIDFRNLVKDLAAKYRKKIFLEQVGPRDRSAIADGCGSCGRNLCCSTFLKDRPPVVMDAVRTQNLYFKDREKLTGLCGKLKCCLNYEVDLYEELAAKMPDVHTQVIVRSSGLKGVIVGRNILDQMLRVKIGDEGHAQMISVTDVDVVTHSRR